MYIGERAYGPCWYRLQFALYGPEYYGEDDSTSFGIAGCAARLLGWEPERDNVDALVEILTMELFQDIDLPFKCINPDAVKWIRKNLIPMMLYLRMYAGILPLDMSCLLIISTPILKRQNMNMLCLRKNLFTDLHICMTNTTTMPNIQEDQKNLTGLLMRPDSG